jgi:hypothetical protein
MVDIIEIITIISGSVFVLFLSGFAWSFVFFKKDEIDWVERIALSFGLSIAIVPLAVFWLNYFLGVKINLLNVSIVILALIGTAAVIFIRKGKYTLDDLYYIKKHELSKNHIIIVGSAVFLIIIIFVISGLISQPRSSELPPPAAPVINVTDTLRVETTQISPVINVTDTPLVSTESNALTLPITLVREPHKYSIKISISHGFIPDVITISKSEIIVWNNEEDQRKRVVLISKDGLFENKILQYSDKYYYQFNSSGNYGFVLTENNTLIEYPKATCNVIVK